MGAPARTSIGAGLEVGEVNDDALGVDMGQTEGPHTRGVDDPTAGVWQFERDSRCRGVSSPAGDIVDLTGGPISLWNKGIDQGGLPDP